MITNPDSPLSRIEIEEWLAMLSPTIRGRIVALREMLKNANGDHMSEADRIVCRQELTRLERHMDEGRDGRTAPTRCPGQCGLPPHVGVSCDEALEAAERLSEGTDGRLRPQSGPIEVLEADNP